MENPTWLSDQTSPPEKNKRNKKTWKWILGGCLVLICLIVIVVAVVLLNIPTEQELLKAECTIPTTVRKGDEFAIIISMKNTTPETVFITHFLLHSYVNPSILDGAEVIYTEPAMEIDETFEKNFGYSYFREISPGETQVVKFHLLAKIVGTFSGPIMAFAENPDKSMLNKPVYAFYMYSVTITITP